MTLQMILCIPYSLILREGSTTACIETHFISRYRIRYRALSTRTVSNSESFASKVPASGVFGPSMPWAGPFLSSCAQGYSSCPTNTTWQVGAEICIMYSTGHSLTYPTIFTKYDTRNPCIECAAKVTLRFGSSVSGRDVQQLRNSLSGASQVPFPLRPSPLPVHMQHGLLTVRCIHKLSKKKGTIHALRSRS